jgi:hypothetical protein
MNIKTINPATEEIIKEYEEISKEQIENLATKSQQAIK